MDTPIFEMKNTTISLENKQIVKNVSISLKKGEILGIVGESGSGKSTIIKAAMGLLGPIGKVSPSSIYFNGEDITHFTNKQMQKLRGRKMGLIFQNSEAALCPIRKIGDQLYESMNQHQKMSKDEMVHLATNLMNKLNLQDGQRILNSYPFELSGGMNQRVAIVMAMMLNPVLLFADEPTSALDTIVQKQVVNELMTLRELYHTSIVFVSHHLGLVSYMADKIAVMKDGELIEYGSKQEIINNPKTEYTKSLLDAIPRLVKG